MSFLDRFYGPKASAQNWPTRAHLTGVGADGVGTAPPGTGTTCAVPTPEPPPAADRVAAGKARATQTLVAPPTDKNGRAQSQASPGGKVSLG